MDGLSVRPSVRTYVYVRACVRRSVQCIVEKWRIRSGCRLASCRTGPGMRQVVGFGNRSSGRGTFRGEYGARHCNQWGLYGVRVRQCLNHRSELRFRVVSAVGRGIAVLDGSHVVQGEGEVLGVFVPHFHNGKCHWVADGEVFAIRMRKLDNISVRKTYRWKARFVGFFAIYSLSRSTLGFMRN